MDLRRALDVAKKYLDEATKGNLVEQLAATARALQTTVTTPNAANDEAFNTQIKTLFAVLDSCETNGWPTIQRRFLEELKLSDHTGRGLRATIDDLFAKNSVTRALALQRMNELTERERTIFTSTNQLVANFKQLGIEAKGPDIGQCEVVISMPAPPSKDTLDRLDTDLDGFNKLLTFVNEIAGQGGTSPRVIGLESGSWMVTLDSTIQAAGHLATLIGAIFTIKAGVATLRRKSKALEDEPDVRPETIKELESLADARVQDGLRKLAEETAALAQNKDSGRRNELATAISINIRFLARRLDEGVRVEIMPPDALPPATLQDKQPEQIEQMQAELASLKEQALLLGKMEENPAPALLLQEPQDKQTQRT